LSASSCELSPTSPGLCDHPITIFAQIDIDMIFAQIEYPVNMSGEIKSPACWGW
jgi:hypothetical protein